MGVMVVFAVNVDGGDSDGVTVMVVMVMVMVVIVMMVMVVLGGDSDRCLLLYVGLGHTLFCGVVVIVRATYKVRGDGDSEGEWTV